MSITDTTSNIIAQSPQEEILDQVYEVVENLEVLLLCSKTCGEEASVILVCNEYSYCFVCVPGSLSHQHKIRGTMFKLEHLSTL